MQIILRLLPVTYLYDKDDDSKTLTIQNFLSKPIAEIDLGEIKNRQQLIDAIDVFLQPYRSEVDAKLYIYGYGRKFPHFDAEKSFPRELHTVPTVVPAKRRR